VRTARCCCVECGWIGSIGLCSTPWCQAPCARGKTGEAGYGQGSSRQAGIKHDVPGYSDPRFSTPGPSETGRRSLVLLLVPRCSSPAHLVSAGGPWQADRRWPLALVGTAWTNAQATDRPTGVRSGGRRSRRLSLWPVRHPARRRRQRPAPRAAVVLCFGRARRLLQRPSQDIVGGLSTLPPRRRVPKAIRRALAAGLPGNFR